MPTYRELLAAARAEIDEISTPEAHALLDRDGGDAPLFVDVRPRDEWDEGHLPGALHLPRNNLESRVEALIPDRSRELVVYCESGTRSAFAAKSLQELGYTNAVNLSDGFAGWKRNGYDFVTPAALTPAQRARYSRHLLIPEVGEEGQQRLLQSRILLIGAGGLGSPASLYLAAAGVGTIGIIDADVVDDSNLQRQIVHSTERLGEPKVESAKRTIEALNPDVTVVPFQERLDSENVERILAHGWDVILDGTDNFPTRYLVNDASVWHGIPVVHGSIYRFEGQVTVFHPGNGPCYRCLYPVAAAARAGAELRRGRRPGRPARHRRLAAGERGAQADARRGRDARRPAAPLRRAPHHLRRGRDSPEPRVPGVRRPPDDHRVHRLRRVLPRDSGARVVTVVRIPPTLRGEVGGARQVEASGETVRDVLEDLVERHPALGNQILTNGGIAPFVNVYLGGEDVRTMDGLDTTVPDGETLILLPAMAGGSSQPWTPAVARSLLDLVGQTPLVELPRISPKESVTIYAKLEGQNPTGSIKDRVAKSMIEAAEASGELEPGRALLEPTSGNTGISLALVAALKGYPLTCVLPENATEERKRLLRLYGADIVHSPASEGSNGAVRLALEMAEADPRWFVPFQYANEANPRAHYEGTGAEIATALDRVDVLVAGLGTGGTLMGAGERLRETFPDVVIAAAEPLPGDPVMGLRSLDDGYVPPILDVSRLDRKVLVSNEQSVAAVRELLRLEGILGGVSAGAAIHVARRLAAELDEGVVVAILADGGWKYLSADFWDAPEAGVEQSMESTVWW